MAMSHDARLDATLQMINVTPENYINLKSDMICYLYHVVLEAEMKLKPESPYEGMSKEEIAEKLAAFTF
jgi:hypothetical protein